MNIGLFGIAAGIVRMQAQESARGALRDETRPPLDEWAIYQEDVQVTRDLGRPAHPPGQARPGVLSSCQPLPARP